MLHLITSCHVLGWLAAQDYGCKEGVRKCDTCQSKAITHKYFVQYGRDSNQHVIKGYYSPY